MREGVYISHDIGISDNIGIGDSGVIVLVYDVVIEWEFDCV